jgi:hypothetical protein
VEEVASITNDRQTIPVEALLANSKTHSTSWAKISLLDSRVSANLKLRVLVFPTKSFI